MIDFSGVKSLVIPEGVVIKICSGDQVLWEKSGLLPSAYQQVEYIETTGTQYIDTGVNPSNYSDGISYVFKGCYTDFTTASGNNYLFGCLNSNKRSGNVAADTRVAKNLIAVYLGTSGFTVYDNTEETTLNKDFELAMTATSVSADNFKATYNGLDFRYRRELNTCDMPNANIYLLHCSGVGSTSKPFYGKLYGFSMDKVDGTPIRNFVPCYRVSDGVIGLYDTVEGKFYENAGTGTFSAGAAVN